MYHKISIILSNKRNHYKRPFSESLSIAKRILFFSCKQVRPSIKNVMEKFRFLGCYWLFASEISGKDPFAK